MKFKFLIFQILTEQVCTQVVHKPHPEPDSTVKIQNPSEQMSLFTITWWLCGQVWE